MQRPIASARAAVSGRFSTRTVAEGRRKERRLPARSCVKHVTSTRRFVAMRSTVAGQMADETWPMRDYTDIVESMKDRYGIRVRKWRRSMSGCAWRVYYHDGRTINWIESPVPKTPISLAIFLHEVGHHVIGFSTYKRRCEEEYHAWQWAITMMRKLGIQPDEKVRK